MTGGVEIGIAVAFGTVFVAELGDKSQLVCLTLAARHRALPVWIGASVAFALLNALAVTVGVGLDALVPRVPLLWAVAALFGVFGLLSLRAREEDVDVEEKGVHGTLLTTFSLIFLAELGDKTQLAVAALAASNGPLGTWTGATCALTLSSLVAVLVGRHVGKRIPPRWLGRVSAIAFLATGAYLGWLAYVAMRAG
jgi:putative Ca2+/H+ antiporter (TMEM165/GDT1 family)